MERENREIKELLVILILCLATGFASVTTVVYIGGRVNITRGTFEVKFSKAVVDGTDISSTAISGDGKTITFQTNDLRSIGDKSVLEYTILNNSNVYDADVSVNCVNDPSATHTDYYQIVQNLASAVTAKTSQNGKIEVKVLRTTTQPITENFKCTLNASAKERTTRVN